VDRSINNNKKTIKIWTNAFFILKHFKQGITLEGNLEPKEVVVVFGPIFLTNTVKNRQCYQQQKLNLS